MRIEEYRAWVRGPLAGIDVGQAMDRFFVANQQGTYDRVRLAQVGPAHLAYWSDADGCWQAVPGREALLAALREDQGER